MTNLVTIITAVYGPSAEYLSDAYKSILDQELPDGWGWQWVIQQDGETDDVAPHVPDDARISFGQGRHGRAGMARTMGLSRATGQFVKVLDADDQLPAGTLARDLAVLTSRPDVAWTTSRVLDLLPDGSTVGFDQDPPAGSIERGEVLAHWKAHDFRAQVHPATLCVRRDLLLALGGWMALPASEDTGLLMALTAVSRGWFIEETGLLYRKWPGQSTHQAAHIHEVERMARMSVIQARAEALLALEAWRLDTA
ncbi:glycosyltransferase family 2 protein [Kitasatospora sp. NPDC059811]|uniref:glycosyltransferase family 2 protein n=1 Tax=Kitasatospora sp. NPDC059811 TaxID=3346957 RepID=UPI00365BA950